MERVREETGALFSLRNIAVTTGDTGIREKSGFLLCGFKAQI